MDFGLKTAVLCTQTHTTTDTHNHRHVSAAAVTVLEGTGGLLGALIDIEKTQMNRLDKQLIK